MVVQVALRLHQLHADVHVLVHLQEVVLDEHGLEDDLGVGVRGIETELVVQDHHGVGIDNVSSPQRLPVPLVALQVDDLLRVGWLPDQA